MTYGFPLIAMTCERFARRHRARGWLDSGPRRGGAAGARVDDGCARDMLA
ncbi:MAG: hypothetical protein ACU0GG_12640 [Paracoccaceae bacterium]